ncbi:MAG: HEAT repeat domain-containing protein [Phycisphaeraceae bacterium]
MTVRANACCAIGWLFRALFALAMCLSGLVSGSAISAAEVTQELSEAAKSSVPDVVRRMQSSDPDVRAALIEELVIPARRSGPTRATPRYKLTDEDYSLILERSLPGLAVHLPEQRQYSLMYEVAFLVKNCKVQGCDVGIAEFAGSPFPSVQRIALRNLIDMRSHAALPFLLPKLHGQDPGQLCDAIRDIVAVKGTEAGPRLEQILEHPDSDTRHWAAWALFQLDARTSAEKLYLTSIKDRQWNQINPYVLAVLIKWDDARTVPIAMRWLTDDALERRSTMRDRLLEVHAKTIQDALIKFLDTGEYEGRTAVANLNTKADAMRLLGAFGSTKAIPALRRLAADKDSTSQVAISQLGTLRAEEAIPDLLTILDTRSDTRLETTLALANIGHPSIVGRVIAELRKQSTGSHRIHVLEALTQAAAPKTYEKLRTTQVKSIDTMPAPEYFAQIAGKVGMTAQLSSAVTPKDREIVVVGQTGHTGLTALRHGVDAINYDGYDYALFLEEDRIHVLPVEEVFTRWDQWLKASRHQQ